jgi:hypothetical protein
VTITLTFREATASVEETVSTATSQDRLFTYTAGNVTATTAITPVPTLTDLPGRVSLAFLLCGDDAKPFCQSVDHSTLYVGTSYYVAWKTLEFHDIHLTVQVKRIQPYRPGCREDFVMAGAT